MGGYTPTVVITLTYLLTVWLLPKLMASREALKLKYTLVVFNFLSVLINLHICTEVLTCATALGYSYSCQPVSYTYDPHEYRMAKAVWWFYFSKCVEMLDTVFFILRKKNNQVSFLHVYHHASMFTIWYIGAKWMAGGVSFLGVMINSFVHVVMYTYYGVAALGPEYQKYLWWKRYLTKLQLLQFFVGIVYGMQMLYVNCEFPHWMAYVGIVYGVTIIALFVNFYIHAYLVKKPKSSSSSSIQDHILCHQLVQEHSQGKQRNGRVHKEDSKKVK